MEPVSFDHLKNLQVGEKRKKGDPRSRRDELLNKFLKRNICIRVKGKLVPLDAPNMAILLSPFKTDQLHDIYERCAAPTTKSFSKMFWFFVNPKK